MNNATTTRFFTVAYTGNNRDSEFSGDQIDTVEITEGCFNGLWDREGEAAIVQRDVYTLFENGASQICLTLDLDQWPHVTELESVL